MNLDQQIEQAQKKYAELMARIKMVEEKLRDLFKRKYK